MTSPFSRICTHPGCHAITRNSTGRCDKHPRVPWAKKPGSPSRGSGTHIQRERKRLFERDPLCAECERAGKVALATIRDHIIPLAEGGSDDESNCQGLCRECDREKTQAEARRGLIRSFGERIERGRA